MVTWTKRRIITFGFLALTATNVLTLTSTAVNTALQAKRKAATSRFGIRLASRTRRVAAKSIAAIPAEAFPVDGVAVLIADTGYEFYAACGTMRDLDRPYSELGMMQRSPDDVIHATSSPGLPDPAEIWENVLEQSGVWLNPVGLNPQQHP